MNLSNESKKIIKSDEIYPEIHYIELELSNTEKLSLINVFHECYFDTALEVEHFAVEFQRVVSHILSDCVPIKLEHLIDFHERILDAFSLVINLEAYKKAKDRKLEKEEAKVLFIKYKKEASKNSLNIVDNSFVLEEAKRIIQEAISEGILEESNIDSYDYIFDELHLIENITIQTVHTYKEEEL